MKIIDITSWDNVYAAWKAASPGQREPNKDVWSLLPENIEWFEAEVEQSDLDCLYTIGSSDWKHVFSTYSLEKVVSAVEASTEDDSYRHISRIKDVSLAAKTDRDKSPPIILVAESSCGPFVAIDGNHRMAGFYMAGCLRGVKVFIGFSSDLYSSFKWYNLAFR